MLTLLLALAPQCLAAEFPPAEDVAISYHGDTLAMSSNIFGYTAGVQPYDLQGGVWVPQETIDGYSIDVEAGFGFSIALSKMFSGEELLAVGAPWNDGGYGPGTGSVVLYEDYWEGHWGYVVHLRAPSPVPGGLFGHSVAADGDFLAISSPGDGNGAVDIYARIGGFWMHTGRVVAPPGVQGFGTDVAVSGNSIAVLANSAAYAYSFMGVPLYTAVPSTAAPYDLLDMSIGVLVMGSSTAGIVDIGGETIHVGSALAGCAMVGSALLVSAADGLHIYDHGITGWTESAKIQDTGELDVAFDRFTLSDVTGVRLYSFNPADCRSQSPRAALPMAVKHY